MFSVFQSTVVRAADPDTDGDGLTDSFELATLYTQRVAAGGLPKGIVDNGVATTVVSILAWNGVMNGAFAEFTINHPTKTELTVQVGYWTGTAWVDRYVWDPGARAPADTTAPSCVPAFAPTAAGTVSGYALSGTTSTVVVDLLKPRTQTTQVERDNKIIPPQFCPGLVHSQLSWRIVIRDWVASSGGGGGCLPTCPIPVGIGDGALAAPGFSPTDTTTNAATQGSLTVFALRVEERSDHTKADTDGDTLRDNVEVNTHRTFPTAIDTDGDAARDDFEAVSRMISYSVDGVAKTVSVKTDPTLWDTDADGLSDGEEYNAGVDRLVTNPVVADTDGDALKDGPEVLTHWSNPLLKDTDKDTIRDDVEVTARTLVLTINGLSQTRSIKTLPYAEDTDGDGLRDDKEWAGTAGFGVKTDPSDADTDDDGLIDNEIWTVFAIRGLSQLETFLTAIENRQPVRYYEPLIRGFITLYTEYVATASPLSRDTDADGLSDSVEYFLHSDPRLKDTDGDRILDGQDDDPTIVEIERPMVWVNSIEGPEFFADFGLTLKRYWVTYSVQDAAGIQEAYVFKDGSQVHYHSVGGAVTAQFRDNFDIGWLDAFDGARFEIVAKDMNGNLDSITLQQPTIFGAVGNFLTSATISGLGPEKGGRLSGGWYAFRDTVVDLATLFLNPGAIFDGGKAVGDAFRSQGISALVALAKTLSEFIDETQKKANPYLASECATNALCNFNVFRYNWYAGYIAATIGLSLVGAAVAKAVVQGLKAPMVLSKVTGAIPDLGNVAKVTQLVNRLRGIGIVNSRILIAGVFTTAFAAGAYAWPEIFGEWFSRYMGGAFVFLGVYNLVNAGIGQKGLKAVTQGIRENVIPDTESMRIRLGRYADGLAYDPFNPPIPKDRLIRLMEGYVDLPNGGGRALRTIVLLQGDAAGGWTHILARHVLGTDTSGTGRLTRFPAALSETQMKSIIEETLVKGVTTADDVFAIVYNFNGRYGIGNMRVILYPDGSGRILTAYPMDGPAVIVVRP